MIKTLLLSHPLLLEHGPLDHPENRSRLEAILLKLQNSSYQNLLQLNLRREAKIDEIARAHDSDYIQRVLSLDGKNGEVDFETPVTPLSVKAACLAAGLGIELVEQILEGKAQNGFALVRPPGHHATNNQGMGFCIFNNIAIAAHHALSKGIQRILILDWDLHQRNGTQQIFYPDERVLFIDIHQEDLFLQGSGSTNEIGEGKGLGYTLNIPLPPSSDDDKYLKVMETIIEPQVFKYKPELILVSAGFDAHEMDPLGSMRITTKGYGLLTQRVKDLSEKVCAGRFALFLEGGYDYEHLAESAFRCVESMC